MAKLCKFAGAAACVTIAGGILAWDLLKRRYSSATPKRPDGTVNHAVGLALVVPRRLLVPPPMEEERFHIEAIPPHVEDGGLQVEAVPPHVEAERFRVDAIPRQEEGGEVRVDVVLPHVEEDMFAVDVILANAEDEGVQVEEVPPHVEEERFRVDTIPRQLDGDEIEVGQHDEDGPHFESLQLVTHQLEVSVVKISAEKAQLEVDRSERGLSSSHRAGTSREGIQISRGRGRGSGRGRGRPRQVGTGRSGPQQMDICLACGEKGHKAVDHNKCRNCGGFGHMTAKCCARDCCGKRWTR